jgi:7-carboxy-7-deazaguanine synthase
LQAITFKIVEIFNSIEGEGKRAGAPASFIRLAGCNLRCSYCDTTYALEENSGKEMCIEEIVKSAIEKNFYRVTITGGEPLLAQNIDILINRLLEEGCEINIETNGSADIAPYITATEKLFFTIDFKLPSSGETEKMHLENYDKLRPCDVLKFVAGSENDIEYMLNFLAMLKSTPQIYIGAAFEKFPLQKLAESIVNEPILKDAKLQLQFHKIIWNPSQRGV